MYTYILKLMTVFMTQLAQLARQGKITRELAMERASVPEELGRLLGAGAATQHAPARSAAPPVGAGYSG